MAGDNEVLAGKEMNLRCRFRVEGRVGSSVLHNQNSTQRSEASTRCAFGSRPKDIPARENRWKRSVCIDSMNKYCTGLKHGQNSPKRHNNGSIIDGLHRYGVDDYLEEHKRTRRAGFYMARRERETVLADWGWCSN